MTVDQIERFERLYQVFATHAFASLSEQLAPVITQAIDKGYVDVICNVYKYSIGMLIIDVEALHYVGDDGGDSENVSSILEEVARNNHY